MATQVQFRRGTTTQNNAFTGAVGELTVDTDIKTLRLHDGSTAGGIGIINTGSSQTLLNKTHSTGSVWQGNAVGLGFGGTGSSLTAAAGAVAFSGASGLGLSAVGTSGQVLTSGGTGAPVWVNPSTVTVGTASTATTATNIAGGSAGQLMIQADTGLTTFITAGAVGTFLQSTGAGYAPTWAAGQVILGSSAVPLGSTATSLNNLTTITMNNGSYGAGAISAPGITGTGPWTVIITGITSTTGINVGQNITATPGTGSLFGGTPTSVVVASIVSPTSITVTVTGGTTPTAGTITGITTFGFLQVPTGTTAQRPYQPAVGMIRYNTSQTTFEGYSAGAWSSLGGVTSVDKFTYIQAETGPTVSNGDLDFFAENSAGNAAQQVGQWNRNNLRDYTGTIVGTQTTQNVFNATATTVNAFGAATTISIGAGTGTLTINNANTVISGNLTVNGTTTTINSTVTSIDDIEFELGSVASPTDTTANGGGIRLKGTTDKTINWSSLGWTSSEDFNLVAGRVYEISGTNVLDASSVLGAATTATVAGAATTLTIGATSGTATIRNSTVAITNNATVGGTLGVTGLITSSSGISGGPSTHTTGTFSGTLGVTGATTLSSTLGVTGLITSSSGISGGPCTHTTGTFSGSIAANAGVALAGGTSLTATHGTWTGEQNKIQWHSDALYFQNTASGRLAVFRQGGGAEPCQISNAGVITCASIQTTSDIKLKENVATIGNASEIINSLRGVTFDWKATQKKSYGLIAQEVEVILPELVEETVDNSLDPNSESTKTVDYDKIVSVLIEGWKEQQSQIKDLQEQVVYLKSKLGE